MFESRKMKTNFIFVKNKKVQFILVIDFKFPFFKRKKKKQTSE